MSTSEFIKTPPDSAALEVVPGRGAIGQLYRLTTPQSRLIPIDDPSGRTCVEESVVGCERGFAMSLWVFLGQGAAGQTTEAIILHAGYETAQEDSPHVVVFIDSIKQTSVQVSNGTWVWRVVVPKGRVPFDDWFNLGFSWKPEEGLAAYINGHRVGSLDIAQSEWTQPLDLQSQWRVIIGNNRANPSASPMIVSDLAIWDRFLFDFERHRYLGITAAELHVLHGADYLWTTDGYFRRDHLSIQSQPGVAASGTILSPSRLVLTPDRDDKGWAVEVDGAAGQWLAFGNKFTDECVSDPSLCQEGITVALWVKLSRLTSADPRTFSFLFSTGAQSSRGCTIYWRGRDRLRATIADGKREWIVEILFTPNKDDWVHIAISWHQSSGLILYINGNNHGWDRTGVVRIRHKDLDTRLLVGRRNDYLGGYAKFTLEQLAIWKKFMEPWQARKQLGLITNRYFASASHYWNKIRLVSSTFDILARSASHDVTVGSVGDVVVADNGVVDLSAPASYLSLGDFTGSCVGNASLCPDGLSISIWLRYVIRQSASPAVIISSIKKKTERGFAVYVHNSLLVARVTSAGRSWCASVKMETLPSYSWTNIAFTWNEVNNLKLYINGVQPRDVIYNERDEDYVSSNRAQLVLGASSKIFPFNPSQPVVYHVHNLAIWEKYIPQWNVHQLLGMSKEEFDCFKFGDYCWTFEPISQLHYNFEFSSTGVVFVTDRMDEGRAICTNGGGGWVLLENFQTSDCPANPAACDQEGFVIAMWVKLKKIVTQRMSGYLLSAGAEKHGENGISMFQSITGIWVKVVKGSQSWQTVIRTSSLMFDRWIYVAVGWSGKSISVSINGNKLPIVTVVKVSHLRSAKSTNSEGQGITLGKSIHGNRGFLSACYDDVMLVLSNAGRDLPLQRKSNNSIKTGNTADLADFSPETGKKPCKISHEADCARTMEELLYVIEEEVAMTDSVAASCLKKLNDLTSANVTLSSTELQDAAKLIQKLSTRTLPESLNETQGVVYLRDFLQPVSNLLNPEHTEGWIMANKGKRGIPFLIANVEKFSSRIAKHLVAAHSSLNEFLVKKNNIFVVLAIIPDDDLVIPGSRSQDWRIIEDTVSIPKGFVASRSNTMETVVLTVYNALHDVVPTVTATNKFSRSEGKPLWVNSRVLSLQVGQPIQEMPANPIVITFTHRKIVTDSDRERPVCAFWNFHVPHTANGAWDRDGCQLEKTDQQQTVCHCYHLTHFAVIVEPKPDEVPDGNAVVLRWLARCLVGISVVFLLILIITYIVSKRLHTLRHSIHLNQCTACLVASVIFALSDTTSDNQVLCLVSGATMHFFYLATTLWVTMEMFQLYKDTSVGGMDASDTVDGFAILRNGMKYYMLTAWGIPAIAVASVMASSRQAYQPQAYDMCWLVKTDGMLWSFSALCCLALCVNVVLLILILHTADETVLSSDKTTGFRSGVFSTSFLNVLFIATWLIGWTAIYGGPLWTSYLFVILNSSMGIFIFVLQGFSNVEVRTILCQEDPDLEFALVRKMPVPLQKSDTPERKPNYLSS